MSARRDTADAKDTSDLKDTWDLKDASDAKDAADASEAWPQEARGRRLLRIGLAVLWLTDAALQLQPPMFTQRMATLLWAAAAQGPAWLTGLVSWSIAFAQPWLPAFNALLAATQLGLGLGLLLSRRPRARATVLWGSLLYAMAVWVFGEGMGGVLAPGSTLLIGAPGSALIYALASALLLLPVGSWHRVRTRWGLAPVQAAGVAVLLAGALWQSAPLWWAPLALAAVPVGGFMMPEPHALRAVLSVAAGLTVSAPDLANGLLVAALLGAAAALALAAQRRAVLIGVLTLLAILWICGQDAGALFSGGATDPNTMAPVALLVWAAWASAARPRGRPVAPR